jgi:hypothetical protein
MSCRIYLPCGSDEVTMLYECSGDAVGLHARAYPVVSGIERILI